MSKVLIIDDNVSVCEAIVHLLMLNDIDAIQALTPQAGINYLEKDDEIDLVIQDMNFTEDTTSGKEGEELYRAVRRIQPDIPVMLMTSWTQVESAVALVKGGAADYFSKPWDNNKLLQSVRNFLELRELQRERREKEQALIASRLELQDNFDLRGLVYMSQSMHRLVDMAVRIAPANASVLISGPNGVGKEKIADIIHHNSRRSTQPFVKVNMAALPKELMEAELFGAEAGAYTGASKRRIGRFESANGGTLFLDEIGNLSLEGQMKLLRVLQTGEFERLGSSETLKVDVRLLSATNADLQDAIDRGAFREDLFYRLNVIALDIPALCDRKEDILPLVFYFLGAGFTIEKSTLKNLQAYKWPGNVRELENSVERAKLLGIAKELSLADFAVEPVEKTDRAKPIFIEPSKEMIEAALASSSGVIAVAARQLGLSRQALYRRMERFAISASGSA